MDQKLIRLKTRYLNLLQDVALIIIDNKIKSYLGSGREVAQNRVALKFIKNSLAFNISYPYKKSII